MKRVSVMCAWLVSLCLMVAVSVKAEVNYLKAKPMSQFINASVGQVNTANGIKLPVITWGADAKVVLADMEGIFKDEGLNVSLFLENNLTKQVEMCISGKTPYIRGTMGMICDASDAFKAKGLDLEVVYQHSWSAGGDAMVVRPGKTLKNIKVVALQVGGPHMDYAANIFKNAGRLGEIQFRWLKELTYTSGDKVVDPVSAFQSDPTIDAVMCITPDANLLTSGGKVGSGAEGSVKGATILMTTKTASQVIADVYAVRKDYFDANRAEVEKFTHALLRSDEALNALIAAKSTQQAKYRQLISKSADLLLGSSTATSDMEGAIADCKLVGFDGNVAFFTGKGTTRNFENLTAEAQNAFIGMGLMSSRVKLYSANWDYSQLSSGLKYASATAAAAAVNLANNEQKFDSKKVSASVEKKINAELSSWEEGTLFTVEITFKANQSDFSVEEYAEDFREALNKAQTYGGSLITIEGHTDPMGVLKAKQDGKNTQEIDAIVQTGKNLSLQRAKAVQASFIKYCKSKGFPVNESQFVPVGLGIKSPKYKEPKTKEQWLANMRVVFRIKQVEAEMSEFEPLQ